MFESDTYRLFFKKIVLENSTLRPYPHLIDICYNIKSSCKSLEGLSLDNLKTSRNIKHICAYLY